METLDQKSKKIVEVTFQSLSVYHALHERQETSYSFGKKEFLKLIFIECFKRFDSTVLDFQWLPEYDKIIEWLVDTKGKGLFMTGDCGRGKTNIIFGVILPIYYMKFKSILPGYSATQLAQRVPPQFEDRYRWNYELYQKWKIAFIDELGTERMVTDFGEKFESFNEILNVTEQKLNVLIISSNLSGKDFQNRYGDRTMDRIKRLCKIVKFVGDSLRLKNEDNTNNDKKI